MRIRPPRLWLLFELLPRLLPIAIIALNPLVYSGGGRWRALDVALLVFAALIGVRILVAGRIELTPTHLVEQGLRRRSIPWSRIQDIAVHRGRVQVWSDDGAVRRLPAPIPKGWYWPGDRFDTEYNQLGQWWVEHRGADWQRLPLNPWASPGRRRAVLDNPWVTAGWIAPK